MILTCPECSARYVVDPKALMPDGRTVRCAKCKHSWKENAPDQDIPQIDPAEAEGPVAEPDAPATETGETTAGPPREIPDPPAEDANDPSDDFSIGRRRRKKRPRPLPKGSNLPALQNHKHGDPLWGWYALAAFLVALVSSFLIFQSTITDIWPPSRQLYRLLDMEDSARKAAPAKDTEEEFAARIPPAKLFRIEEIVPSKVIEDQVTTLRITGNIRNISGETHPLPLLRISLKNNSGATVRDWTFKSAAATIGRDETVGFSTALPNPPADATSVNVTFAEDQH